MKLTGLIRKFVTAMSNNIIGTHNGTFHCDEVLACVMLRMLPEYKQSEIVRTRDSSRLETCSIVVDVGAVFNPHIHRYDHHQRSFSESMKTILGKKWVTKLSSAGLVYAHFGKRVISSALIDISAEHAGDDKLIDIIYDKVYENFIEEIDAIDNGISVSGDQPYLYRITTTLSSRVSNLNLKWNEPTTPELERAAFDAAMALVSTELLDRIRYFAKVWWPARDIVIKSIEQRYQVDPSGQIVRLVESCPWKEHLFDVEAEFGIAGELKYVLFASDVTATSWRVQCVPTAPTDFSTRRSLPSPWCGLRDAELSARAGIADCVFVHASGFIGGNLTYEGALAMAVKALEFVSL